MSTHTDGEPLEEVAPLGSSWNPVDRDHYRRVLDALFEWPLCHKSWREQDPNTGGFALVPPLRHSHLQDVEVTDEADPRVHARLQARHETIPEMWEALQARDLLPHASLPWSFYWHDRHAPQTHPENVRNLLALAFYTPRTLRTAEELVRAALNDVPVRGIVWDVLSAAECARSCLWEDPDPERENPLLRMGLYVRYDFLEEDLARVLLATPAFMVSAR